MLVARGVLDKKVKVTENLVIFRIQRFHIDFRVGVGAITCWGWGRGAAAPT